MVHYNTIDPNIPYHTIVDNILLFSLDRVVAQNPQHSTEALWIPSVSSELHTIAKHLLSKPYTMPALPHTNCLFQRLWCAALFSMLVSRSITEAFVPRNTRPVVVQRRSLPPTLAAYPPDNNLPGFDCDDDGECEIDWDAMPSFDEQNMDNETEEDDEVEAVFYDDLEIAQERVGARNPTVEHRRLHMEMQWQLTETADECVVEKPETCGSEKCAECHGRGWSDCRFCHGTTVLRMDKTVPSSPTSLPSEEEVPTTMAGVLTSATPTAYKKFILPSTFSACKICQQGIEMCRTCQGSGWVAAWTQLPTQLSNQDDDPLLP